MSTIVKLQVKAGQANPAPPVGTALGPHGINIAGFCKEFNDKTADMEKGLVLPVEITIQKDRSFTFIIKSPPASVLIKKILKLAKGSSVPQENKVGHLTLEHLKSIVETKKADLNAVDEDAAMRIIAGTARSMGVTTDLDREEA